MDTKKHDALDADWRVVNTQWQIHMAEKFLELTEAQMGEVIKRELEEVKASLTHSKDYEEYLMELNHQEDFYEEGILPILRYSHVVLLHILIETRLRAFCRLMKEEKKLPEILPSDFRGGPVEQVQLYLKKLVGISVNEIPGWDALKDFQKVRDCIVHVFGEVAESKDKDYLHVLASKNLGIQIDEVGRLKVDSTFCASQILNIRNFFDGLFLKCGWWGK